MYTLSKLTHVCRFWRIALINKPRAWATIFVTEDDRRSFVEMCLKRSLPVPLEVTVHASEIGRHHPSCTCDKGLRKRLLPSEINPCEWHFVFETLAESRHSKRISMLNILFYGGYISPQGRIGLVLGSCQFFTLPFPQLVRLEWKNKSTQYVNHLFSIPPFPPTLRSLSFTGYWHRQLTQANNLTALALESYPDKVRVETFRTLMLNNRSLETLSLNRINLEGNSNGPPVHLSNLKSFSVCFPPKILASLVRVPALQRLSSLHISCTRDEGEGDGRFTFRATGDGITFSVKSDLVRIGETWQDFTGYAGPTTYHVRLHDDQQGVDLADGEGGAVIFLFTDAHTLGIGYKYFPFIYTDFFGNLKQLGPQLKTIRFELLAETEPFNLGVGCDYENWDGYLLDDIEDHVRYRFEQGRPFSSVERMVVGGSECTNRQQDYVWRCFYCDRRLDRYI